MSFVSPQVVPVEGLGLDTDAAVWLGVSSAERLALEARRARMPLGPSDDVITLSPGAVASADALRRFRRASEGVSGDVVGTLAGPVAHWAREPAFGPPARLIRLRRGGEGSPERSAAATPIEVEVQSRSLSIDIADVPGGRAHEVHLSDAVLCTTSHWSGLLWANLLGLGPALWRELVGRPWWAPVRLAWALLRARSVDPFRMAGALNRVGRGARIHPSAVVEGAWVGRGARIGPGVVVRGSIIGAGATVEAQALVAWSVLGPGAHVQRRGWVQYSVLHPDSAHGGAMQLGVLGTGASVKDGSYLMDQGAGRPVRASVAGELVQAPLGLLGVGVGSGTFVGSGVWVAAGRTLPPGQRVLAPEDRVVRGVDP